MVGNLRPGSLKRKFQACWRVKSFGKKIGAHAVVLSCGVKFRDAVAFVGR